MAFGAEAAHGYAALFGFAHSNGQDNRHFGQRMFTHFVIDFLIARIGARPQALRLQRCHHLMRIIIRIGDNRANDNLFGCQPKRHFAGIAFNHHAEEALHRAQHGAVQHHRTVLIAILANISGVQTLRQHKVELQRAALPCAANCIAQVIFDFRAVKRALIGQFFPIEADFCQRVAQALLGAIPDRIITGPHIGAQRQLDRHIGEAQILVDLCHQPAKINGFRNNLVFAAENMRVILRHLAHPHQAVQRAMRLVAVTAAKFGHAYRQVAI